MGSENKRSVAIVIPVYKRFSLLTSEELHSLNQCFNILEKYDIYFAGPQGLDFENYNSYAKKFGVKCLIKKFDPFYFKNIDGYNILLKSSFFYKNFKYYSYMLIYQTDAYVFRDELAIWCDKGYDYIGAPWFEGFTNNSSTEFRGVGNGGFSIRKIKTALKLAKRTERIHKVIFLLNKYNPLKNISLIKRLIDYTIFTLIFDIQDRYTFIKLNINDKIYEDRFWGELIPKIYNSFKVASVNDALQFSFEVNPRYLYQLNNSRLPFGCHAWQKHDPAFWIPYISLDQKDQGLSKC